MDDLSSIKDCCHSMRSDKITERRKAAERLLDFLLKNEEYVSALNCNSEAKKGLFDWNDVFRAACAFLRKEAEKAKSDNEKCSSTATPSSTSRRPRQNYLDNSARYVREVINRATERHPYLDVTEVLDHVLQTMLDPYLAPVLTSTYVAALNDQIIPVRKYWTNIKPNLWQSLFILIKKLLSSEDRSKVSTLDLARLMKSIVKYSVRQSDVVLVIGKKLGFFVEYFNKIDPVKEARVCETFLETCFHVGLAIGYENRDELCRFTETVLDKVLSCLKTLWNGTDMVVNFCLLTIVAHHPNDGSDPDSGAGSNCPWQQWVKKLSKMYNVIEDYISAKNSASNRDPRLSSNMVNLAVGLLFQLEKRKDCDSSGSSSSNGRDILEREERLPKKRRLLSRFDSLIDAVTGAASLRQSIPWLQILAAFVYRHPTALPEEDLVRLLQQLGTMLIGSRQFELFSDSLALYKAGLRALKLRQRMDMTRDDLRFDQLFYCALKCVESGRSERQALALAALLLKEHLVSPYAAPKVLVLFSSKYLRPSRSSLAVLAAFLAHYKVVKTAAETLSSTAPAFDSTLNMTGARHEELPSHSELLDWLLPLDPKMFPDIEGVGHSFSSIPISLCSEKPLHGVDAIVTDDYLFGDFSVQSEAEVQCKLLEDHFTYTALQKSLPPAKNVAIPEMKLQDVPEEILERLSTCCISSAGCMDDIQIVTKLSEDIVLGSCRILRIASGFLVSGDMADGSFSETVVTLAEKVFGVCLTSVTSNDRAYSGCLRNVLDAIKGLISGNSSLVEAFTDPVFSTLAEVCSGLLGLLPFGKTGSRSIPEPAEQVDFHTAFGRAGNELVFSVDSVFDFQTLSEKDALAVEAARLIGIFCSVTTTCQRKRLIRTATRQKLFRLFALGDFNPENLRHFQVAFVLLKQFCISLDCGDLDEGEVSALVKLAHALSQKCPLDWEIQVAILGLVPNLFSHVNSCGNAASKAECLDMLSEIYDRYNQDLYGPPVQQALFECFARLGKVDPEFQWLVWSQSHLGVSEDSLPIALEVLRGFSSSLSSSIVAASRVLHLLLDPSVARMQRTDWEDRVFSLFYSSVMVDNDEATRLDPSSIAGVLQTTVSMIRNSAWLEKKTLYAMFSFTDLKKNGADHLKRCLSLLAEYYSVDVPTYVMPHLNFVLHRWLGERDYRSFPWQVLASSEVEFVRASREVIIPVLLASSKEEDLNHLARVLGTSLADLIGECFGCIAGRFLPGYMACLLRQRNTAALQDVGATRMKQAVAVWITVERFLGKDGLKARHQTSLVDTFTCLLTLVWDGVEAARLFGENAVLPKIVPVSFSKATLSEAVRRLNDDLDFEREDYAALSAFANKEPLKIHQILMNLLTLYEKAYRFEHKQQALTSLSVFIDCTLDLFSRDGLNDVTDYLIPFLVSRLCYIVASEESETLKRGGLVVIQKLCQTVCAYCPEKLARQLPLIVDAVAPYAGKNQNLQWLAGGILKSLVIDSKAKLKAAIIRLSPFPEEPEYAVLKTAHEELKYEDGQLSLEEEIQIFIETFHANPGKNRCERLRYLASLLRNRQSDLTRLYPNNSDDNSSADISTRSSSQLQKLVHLLCSSAHTADPGAAEMAAKCLGELGPGDLSSFVLQAPDDCNSNMTDGQLAELVFSRLCTYFTSEDLELVRITTDTLLSARETSEGYVYLTSGPAHFTGVLQPFKPVKRPVASKLTVNFALIDEQVNRSELWLPLRCSVRYKEWITRLTHTLLTALSGTSILTVLRPLCQVQVDLCEALLPRIVQVLLIQGQLQVKKVISNQVNSFFSSFSSTSSIDDIGTAKPIIRTMLNIVSYLRTQQKPKTLIVNPPGTAWENNFWLDINYLNVAKAAELCSAYFTSLMFTELWCDKMNGASQQNAPTETFNVSSLSALDSTSSGDTTEEKAVQDILFSAYSFIGDPDAVKGIHLARLCDPSSRITLYEQDEKWNLALEYSDALLSFKPEDGSGVHRRIVSSLMQSGLYNSAISYIAGVTTTEQASLREYQYECAWKLGQWDHEVIADRNEANVGFNALVLKAVKSLRTKEWLNFGEAVRQSRLALVQPFAHSNLESTRNVYPSLSRLRFLSELEDFAGLFEGKLSLPTLQEKWQLRDRVTVSDRALIEPQMALRGSLLNEIMRQRKALNNEDTADVAEALLYIVRLARDCGHLQTANRWLMCCRNLGLPAESKLAFEARFEEALLAWCAGERAVAVNLMKSVLLLMQKERVQDLQYARVLLELGKWMHETNFESPRVIIQTYFRTACSIARQQLNIAATSAGETSSLEAQGQLAAYADSLYKNIVAHIRSDVFQAQEKSLQIRLAQAREWEKQHHKAMAKEEYKARSFLKNEAESDLQEKATLEGLKHDYLEEAVENYLVCLAKGKGKHFDDRLFRLVSLWFDNRSDHKVTDLLTRWLPKVPSYKFVQLLPQLAARLGTQKSHDHPDFSKLLLRILERCATEHPHHTLPILLSLALADQDRPASHTHSTSLEERIRAARALLNSLKKSNIGELSAKMEQLYSVLIKMANDKGSQQNVGKHTYPQLAKLKGYEDVTMTTMEVPVSKSGSYNVVGISRYESSYEFVGGVNAPKKILCRGTDGRTRPQLLKGNDDPRQDAVMEQVFTVMNYFLQNNSQTRNRKLRMRTYKVVPLSRRTGVIEWCENTQPIGSYLIGRNQDGGAHTKYHPNDIGPKSCTEKFSKIPKTASLESRMEQYQKLCSEFQPVFRHFFFERFTCPSVWFERRLTYTRSVATSSMIGYILGLGDRHLVNILIDEKTTELIHIDLGIAFEQGRVLPVPELVPFRLTRDIVDAMGITGVEGVFRSCCEHTLEVLKTHKDSIITLLEVLLYDPLYLWALTPQKAAAVQARRGGSTARLPVEPENLPEEGEVNKSAERVLMRMRQKLQGVEQDISLSVSGQVNYLIQQAIDPANLCRIFFGWKPFV